MRNIVGILIAVTCMCACENVVQLDVPREESQLVVNSLFHPDSTFGISLFQSQFVLDNDDFKKVLGATVRLTDGEGNELATLQEGESGIYTSNLKPQLGQTYRLTVSKEGFDVATATDSVPTDTARIIKHEMKSQSGTSFNDLSIWIDDPIGEDYYELSGHAKSLIYAENDTIRYSDELSFSSDDPTFDHFEGSSKRRFFFDDVLFDGQEKKLNMQVLIATAQCSDSGSDCRDEHSATLYLRKISQSYFQYRESVELQGELSENPFAEPVPAYDNIENGMGIFAGYTVSEYPIEISEN